MALARFLLAVLAVLAALCAAHVQASTVDDTHYVAAVVDYHAPMLMHLTPEQVIMKNIEAVGGFMAQAAAKGVDIIVFPEDGLQGLANQPFPMDVPGSEDNATPCTALNPNTARPLRELSCLSAKHKMYLLVSVVHQVPCSRLQDSKCRERGYYNYNTNVIFDRSGMIVARYHKYNLFGEYNNDVPPTVEYTTFETDFGVRFGTFICFDILFNTPTVELARKLKVTDFVYSAAWFSEVPFLTAVQAHSGWAHALDVTVLAAGLNNPQGGSTGSGIYRGRHGILNSTLNWRTESTMMVHRVPKHGHWDDAALPQPDAQRLDPVLNYASGKADPYDDVKALRMLQDNMTMYTTQLLARPGRGVGEDTDQKLCSGELCCRFQIKAQGTSLFQTSSGAASMHAGYSRRRDAPSLDKAQAEKDFDGFHYRMVAFSGVRDHSKVATTGVQICGLISCLSEDLASCGWAVGGLDSPDILWTEFLSIRITGEYEKEGTLQFASTLAGPRYEQLPANVYTLDSIDALAGNKQTVRLTLLNKPILDIRTFAIYGRYFAWDGKKATGY